MVSEDDLRRLALALPDAAESEPLTYSRAGRGFVWSWKERVHPKKPRVPRLDVLAVRVGHEGIKQALLESDPEVFFTEPHYNGFPAVLVRLDRIEPEALAPLLEGAWASVPPKKKR